MTEDHKGDRHNAPLASGFRPPNQVGAARSTANSDSGLLAYRQLDEAFGLTSTAATVLHDTRTGLNTQHRLLALVRQSIYSRLAGYEDVNDAERLCFDPVMRTIVGGRAKDTQAATTSENARFETEALSAHLKPLMHLSHLLIDQVNRQQQLTMLLLDLDNSVSKTPGHQEGTAYNGYFVCNS